MIKEPTYWIGLDAGSTTIKIVLIDQDTGQVLDRIYERHNSHPLECLVDNLQQLMKKRGDINLKIAFCGSSGKSIARATGHFFIQEVLANTIAIQNLYPQTRVAIELGGQDAKVIFFNKDQNTGQILASDMRMNGVCAGGTGAFIDEIAQLLKIEPEFFNTVAAKGRRNFDISGRCGVFAKTDIQPLLNQGVEKSDIALSTFHAIAKQTIGGLAQGMEIKGPVIFEGGPLFFNPGLISVFQERLGLKENEVIRPEHSETIVATGAALYWKNPMAEPKESTISHLIQQLKQGKQRKTDELPVPDRIFFNTNKEKSDFWKRLGESDQVKPVKAGTTGNIPVYLGIDAGSTTTKMVLIDTDGAVLDQFYARNEGEPLMVARDAVLKIMDRWQKRGIPLEILGVGTTGYGEKLFARAFGADHHMVETIAHAAAAQKYYPDVTFILDIGGQDMKAISLTNSIITDISLNEACSAGCGSFIENFAKNMGVPVEGIADKAFQSSHPVDLGSRCTVFMNSSIISAQSRGATREDILAGLCFSIVENVFTKVLRMSNFDQLGQHIMVQGGTFKNEAVLRAFEIYLGRKVMRAPYPGQMGAIGIALLTQRHMEKEGLTSSDFIGRQQLENFSYERKSGIPCRLCSNNCQRTVIEFNGGSYFVTGNRCECGETIDHTSSPAGPDVPDLVKARRGLLFKQYLPTVPKEAARVIGIPRVLEFWESAPFWKALFEQLGFKVIFSSQSTIELYESGLSSVPSDTACFPAKLAHGHLLDLIERNVDMIFYPVQIEKLKQSPDDRSRNYCSLVQAYPVVLKNNIDVESVYNIPFLSPTFQWRTPKARKLQLQDWFEETFQFSPSTTGAALDRAIEAQQLFEEDLLHKGTSLLKRLHQFHEWGIVIAGRPYHSDRLVNHDLSGYFTSQQIPVFTPDSLPGLDDVKLEGIRPDTVNPFHDRMFKTAIYAASHPDLELVQIVSFGCGHDAVISDEIKRVMNEISGKEPLILKMDESENSGPIHIRIKSFIETVKIRRNKAEIVHRDIVRPLKDPFVPKYLKKDRKQRTIMVPTLSPSFSELITAVIASEGYKVMQLPQADQRAIQLGKQYVHNDICYPAQLNIGECLAFLETAEKPEEYAMGLAKNCVDCRLTHYGALTRKALDDAGYKNTAVITTDRDVQDMHPGLYFGETFKWKMAWGLALIDSLEEVVRRSRAYAMDKQAVENIYREYRTDIIQTVTGNIPGALKKLKEAIGRLNNLEMDPEGTHPRALIIGELLLNYHPTSNLGIEGYLLKHGIEPILPRFSDFFRMEYMRYNVEREKFHIDYPVWKSVYFKGVDKVMEFVINQVDRVERTFQLYQKRTDTHEIYTNASQFVDMNYTNGEGWLLPGEIVTYAKKGVDSFVVVQPFGCLPNHVTGRGLFKEIKRQYPDIQILALDYDPDTSQANIENRLQMMIMNARMMNEQKKAM
jgi:predicted CoA-substrate-specific enzyme activase